MLLRWPVVVAIFATLVIAIDDNTFKDCSRTPFCSKFRDFTPDVDSQFQANYGKLKVTDDVLTIPLTNAKNKELQLVITQDVQTIRIKIQETNTKRFELKVGHSLHAEPKKLRFTQQNIEDGVRLHIHQNGDDSRPIYYFIDIIQGPPFQVVIRDRLLMPRTILDGERFLMENVEEDCRIEQLGNTVDKIYVNTEIKPLPTRYVLQFHVSLIDRVSAYSALKTDDSQTFTFLMKFETEKLYGLFDHAWKLSLGITADGSMDPFRLRNSDSYGYDANSPMALYGSHPVIYWHNEDHTGGIFLNNAAEQWIDIDGNETESSAYFIVESAAFDLFVLMGPTPQMAVNQITELTGRAHLPQLWTLGYHQSRYSYESQDDVKEVVAQMIENTFPMDAIWLDLYYADGARYFKWNSTTFTDPVEMQQTIASSNKFLVCISDPHIKVEDTYDVYAGAKGKYFVQWTNGTDYKAECWPGQSSWIDFFLPEAADYYSSWYSFDKFVDSTSTLAGIWNDMNEPAIFNEQDDIEKSFPYELVHRLDNDGTTVRHRDVHNIYGLMHTRATHKGLLLRDDNKKRPFVLTRSTFAGSQTVAAVWTGDNTASWEHFANAITQCMTGNLVGMVFCGADIGGFIGDPSEELIQRWYQGAVWLPFFRGHSSIDTKRREPYLFSESVQNVVRSAIELRYKHIWHIYLLFFQHTRFGSAIISPLFYQYPGIQDRDTQILIGKNIMAVAVVNASVSSVEVFFPGSEKEVWYRIDDDSWTSYSTNTTEDINMDISTSPVFYRGGGIVVRKDIVKLSTSEAFDDPYTLYINTDKNNTAEGNFYFDDFTSFNYATNEDFVYYDVIWNPDEKAVNFTRLNGNMLNPKFVISDFVVHSIQESEETEDEVVKKVYTTTRDGRLLKSINIPSETSKSGSFVIYL